MITKFMVQTEDGDPPRAAALRYRLASRKAFMTMHPASDPDCTLEEGDIIELEEGCFVLNNDLNPMKLATEEQIASARERI